MKLRILLLLSLLGLCTLAHAQTLTVLHAFSGGSDGANPYAGVTLDSGGNIYGTAAYGGSSSDGTAFKITARTRTFSVLNTFNLSGGTNPSSRILLGPSGLYYGATLTGSTDGRGNVFSLQPPPTICGSVSCPWTERVLYSFNSGAGYNTFGSDLAFDGSGNMYGTVAYGGDYGYGAVFELTSNGSGGWNYSNIFSFRVGGIIPSGGPAFDSSGNIYVPTQQGGNYSCGTVTKLSYSGGTWNEMVLHHFTCSGLGANGTLLLDSSGNIYGVSQYTDGSPSTPGGVWRLTSSGVYLVLHTWSNGFGGPAAGLTTDSAGNLYGTTTGDGTFSSGNVFKLSAGTFSYTDLYDFTAGPDGAEPWCQAALDSSGNIYGTTAYGGSGYGVVWKLVPSTSQGQR